MKEGRNLQNFQFFEGSEGGFINTSQLVVVQLPVNNNKTNHK